MAMVKLNFMMENKYFPFREIRLPINIHSSKFYYKYDNWNFEVTLRDFKLDTITPAQCMVNYIITAFAAFIDDFSIEQQLPDVSLKEKYQFLENFGKTQSQKSVNDMKIIPIFNTRDKKMKLEFPGHNRGEIIRLTIIVVNEWEFAKQINMSIQTVTALSKTIQDIVNEHNTMMNEIKKQFTKEIELYKNICDAVDSLHDIPRAMKRVDKAKDKVNEKIKDDVHDG